MRPMMFTGIVKELVEGFNRIVVLYNDGDYCYSSIHVSPPCYTYNNYSCSVPSWDISSEQSNILLNSSSQQNSARVENWIELTANGDFVESYVLAAVTERTV